MNSEGSAQERSRSFVLSLSSTGRWCRRRTDVSRLFRHRPLRQDADGEISGTHRRRSRGDLLWPLRRRPVSTRRTTIRTASRSDSSRSGGHDRKCRPSDIAMKRDVVVLLTRAPYGRVHVRRATLVRAASPRVRPARRHSCLHGRRHYAARSDVDRDALNMPGHIADLREQNGAMFVDAAAMTERVSPPTRSLTT